MQHEAIATLLNRSSTQERLTREEEYHFIENYQHTVIAKEKQACLGRLIEDNLVYLYSLVKKFNYSPRLSEEDAFGFAIERTINAIEKFDVSRGNRLSTYLRLQILDEMQSKSAKCGGAISIPRRQVGQFYETELEADDWVCFEEDVSDPGLYQALQEALTTLSAAEQYVIRSRFFENQSVQVAAEKQGWNSSRFHKIKHVALTKLKERINVFREQQSYTEFEFEAQYPTAFDIDFVSTLGSEEDIQVDNVKQPVSFDVKSNFNDLETEAEYKIPLTLDREVESIAEQEPPVALVQQTELSKSNLNELETEARFRISMISDQEPESPSEENHPVADINLSKSSKDISNLYELETEVEYKIPLTLDQDVESIAEQEPPVALVQQTELSKSNLNELETEARFRISMISDQEPASPPEENHPVADINLSKSSNDISNLYELETEAPPRIPEIFALDIEDSLFQRIRQSIQIKLLEQSSLTRLFEVFQSPVLLAFKQIVEPVNERWEKTIPFCQKSAGKLRLNSS